MATKRHEKAQKLWQVQDLTFRAFLCLFVAILFDYFTAVTTTVPLSWPLKSVFASASMATV